MTRYAGIAALLLAGGVAMACEDGTEPTPETATVVVDVFADGEPRSGVTVRLFEGSSTTSTGTTGASGRASFTGVDAGTYEAEVEAPAGLFVAANDDDRKPVTASAGGTVGVTFDLASTDGASVAVVELVNVSFTPSAVAITPGSSVRWVYVSGPPHTVTPDGHTEWSEAALSQEGDMFAHTFEDAGDFPYYCVPHRSAGMTGTITVQ